MKGVPENIYDYSQPFEVDQILQRLRQPRSRIKLHKRWEAKNDPEIIDYLRRCLEVAIHLGFEADEPLKYGAFAADWKIRASMADRATGSLEEFIKYITGLGSSRLSLDGETYLKNRLFTLHNATSNATLPESNTRAQADAAALMRAHELLVQYADYARSKGDNLTKGRQHPGKPGKAAFVLSLAESWIWLTGRIPGKGTQEDKNPFIDFLAAAWKDAGEEEEDFIHPTRQAVDELSIRFSKESLDKFKPYWLGE
ncbi:hypothetical protein ASF03_21395 [Rhizobium sp. Leaf68]|nr:hypothetical protein ASE62_20850 [Rhizobium sp. Leaf202]KQN80479.1 hypothetical protein ASF03_21395 [Rhizobium sp. Leaf68]